MVVRHKEASAAALSGVGARALDKGEAAPVTPVPPVTLARHGLDDPEPDSQAEMQDGVIASEHERNLGIQGQLDTTSLGTSLQAKSRRRKIRAVTSEHHQAMKRLRTTVLQALQPRMQCATSLINSLGHARDENAAFESGIHGSHLLRHVHGHTDAFFCTACGAYNAGGPLRVLRKECGGTVPRNRTFALRLLSLGIVPGPGAALPSHARR